ncbi:hypothetical protein M0802_013809 [Mischocyttarus mexicanus]|nr:hypothetical protein M0802_013809 [Mischocyttarus mexicanus]
MPVIQIIAKTPTIVGTDKKKALHYTGAAYNNIGLNSILYIIARLCFDIGDPLTMSGYSFLWTKPGRFFDGSSLIISYSSQGVVANLCHSSVFSSAKY